MLSFLGRHGRWVLPVGLLAGLALPQLATPLLRAVPACIVALLFISCLRVRLDRFRGPGELTGSLPLVLLLQLVLPLAVLAVLRLAAVGPAWQLPILLVCAAAPITGSPNIVLMLGGNASLALRSLMLGTALLPVTALPILYAAFPDAPLPSLLQAVLRLLLLIVVAVLLALVILRLAHGSASRPARWPWLADALSPARLDGLAALLLVAMVIGLMASLHRPDATPARIGAMLALAASLNLALQWLGGRVGLWRHRRFLLGAPHGPGTSRDATAGEATGGDGYDAARDAIAVGVMCGNRNIALFLSAMPLMLSADFLLFMACYQVPMYLSPLLGAWLYPRPCRASS